MSAVITYSSLFLVAFAAATILPLQSEAALAGLLLTGDYAPWLLVLAASAGNVLGSTMNWLLGRGIEQYHGKSWFPVKPQSLERTRRWYTRYGRWSLLLSWMPFIGDPLTVVAGIMKERLAIFVALVAVAKTIRYVAVALMALSLS